MNTIRAVTYTIVRTYRTKYVRTVNELKGIKSKVKLESSLNSKLDLEQMDIEDIDEYEADFMNLAESHIMHERESAAAKEKLKRQIVAQKYFKEVEPSFLTFIEKDQIKKLHEENPDVWTVEQLSQSFPALPDVIAKVLKSKWAPKSVERVMKYDEKVIQNWKDFRMNKLAVSPALREHLLKFKDRKISLTDREVIAEKLVPPKFEIPKPRSTLFRSLVGGCIDEEEEDPTKRLISQSENTNVKENKTMRCENKNGASMKEITAQKKYDKHDYNAPSQLAVVQRKKKEPMDKRLTFNEFVKERLEEIYKTSPEEGIVLLETYRKHIQATNNEESDETSLEVASNDTNNKITSQKDTSDAVTIPPRKEKQSKVIPKKADENVIDTYIKEWNKKTDIQLAYALPIKIPKNVYKEGMTYRIQDCYYDDDGEFLYRTPGLRS